MDAVHSGTGVFYQAMPAVGADGKNIMKLIPVQMVNGQFVQIQISKPKTDPTPQKAVSINFAALNPSATQQTVSNQFSLVNGSANQVGLDLGNPLNKHPSQKQTVYFKAKVPQMATPAANCGNSLRPPKQLPVTVKSPALPRGQYLQIPPNAQVRTVPASELPLGIKKQIFTSSASSPPCSGLPSVVYVSPITTVNQGATPPGDSALQKLLYNTPNKTSHGSVGSKPRLKLIPTVSQRSSGPLKWVIEEEDWSMAPTPDFMKSPSVTSEILRAVAERENATKHQDVIHKPASQPSPGRGGQEQENALVMCNGKVFFVAKKCSLSPKMRRSHVPTAATNSYEFNKTAISSSQTSLWSAAPKSKPDFRIIIPDESDEVIDLCDDDAQDDSSQPAAAVPPLDEDNVIFVSYIPPKSESGSTQKSRLKTQKAPLNEADQTAASSWNSDTELKSLDGTGDCGGRQEVNDLRDKIPGQSTVQNVTQNVCGSTVVNVHDNEGSNTSSQPSSCTQQLQSVEGDAADPSSSDRHKGRCSPTEQDTHNMETTRTTPESRQIDDLLLRRLFGITADVKIRLQRIDEASTGSVYADPPQESAEDHQELTSRFTELFSQDLQSPHETDSCNGLIVVGPPEQEPSADHPASLPHTDSETFKCSHFKLNTQHLSGQSSPEESCDVESEPVIGYVEPIEEDFLSADENDIPNSQDAAVRPQAQNHVDLSTNTRRMGRMRKRTRCPCCIPSAKSEEPERKWAWTAEQTGKKGGRTKGVRKEVKTSGRISCLTAETQQVCKTYALPAGGTLTSMDSDELTRHEQIRRLRVLLKEKEAALELMRNT
ncbi:ligand-dependent nuclear receptor-interacting factor 1 isoform X2 [Micropterus salmoides]|uniref:ligand-dependent nuclear receptor-interacting factor 1 isoform X2 n=1 Tax=Micropterus salmoides TaxID=27706 RepID=UPI0018EA4A1F|nr:ligand-dependent nuclear receptor-interacting factor 1 isoform X2 [Micropterus salmoides]